MTGRTLHDALLRVLTSADRRQRLRAAGSVPGVGMEEAAVLRAADAEQLDRLARFMGRHYYRERIVRLFAASRLLARRRGADPLGVLDGAAFGRLLAEAELGSAATAEGVARLVERALEPALAGFPYAHDLVAYEGALFRAEAGPRRWREAVEAAGTVPVRSPHARVCALEWDVTGLVAAVRRGDGKLPEPVPAPTRLLLALGPGGRISTLRCPQAVERLLGLLDGVSSMAAAAEAVGLAEAEATRLVRQLADVGAVEWTAPTR